MHAKYYLCAIVGDGSDLSPYRPSVADYPVSWAGGFDCGPDGRPVHAECVCVVTCEDHAVLADDPSLYEFPAEGPVDTVDLQAVGFDLPGVTEWPAVIQACGEQRSTGFDLSVLHVQ